MLANRSLTLTMPRRRKARQNAARVCKGDELTVAIQELLREGAGFLAATSVVRWKFLQRQTWWFVFLSVPAAGSGWSF